MEQTAQEVEVEVVLIAMFHLLQLVKEVVEMVDQELL
jgi:hypothetical protein